MLPKSCGTSWARTTSCSGFVKFDAAIILPECTNSEGITPDMIDPRVAGGLRDLPPSASIPRERMLDCFRKSFASFGFLPIETPHIERMEVLTGKGAGSEEVLRQIFEVNNKGGKLGELALRFDLTVPLARFIAKHVHELGIPFKRYAIGSVFRGESPGKGRFREFTQCDFDTVGTESVVADAETAAVIYDALASAGVPKFTISLNNRKVLDGFLDMIGASDRVGGVLRALDKLAKIGRARVLEELSGAETIDPDPDKPPRVALLSVTQAERLLAFVEGGRGDGDEVLSRAASELGTNPRAAEGLANLREVWRILMSAGVPRASARIDLGLARGLDYYTGVVYETTVDGWERFGSIASGGRYDDLASLFTERRLPGVGASIGLDRLLALLEESGGLGRSSSPAPVLVTQSAGVDAAVSMAIAVRLRRAGIGAEVFPDPIATGKQMAYGSSRGHRFGLIVGPEEAEAQTFRLRDLATRKELKAIAWVNLESSVAEALQFQPTSPS